MNSLYTLRKVYWSKSLNQEKYAKNPVNTKQINLFLLSISSNNDKNNHIVIYQWCFISASTLEYQLTPLTPSSAPFNINQPATGNIVVTSSLDYETGDNVSCLDCIFLFSIISLYIVIQRMLR